MIVNVIIAWMIFWEMIGTLLLLPVVFFISVRHLNGEILEDYIKEMLGMYKDFKNCLTFIIE